MVIWKPLAGECLQYRKEPTNEMDRITVARAPTHSHCQEEVVGQVQQKFSSLQLQNPSTKEGDRN